jgi:hypothetical protein
MSLPTTDPHLRPLRSRPSELRIVFLHSNVYVGPVPDKRPCLGLIPTKDRLHRLQRWWCVTHFMGEGYAICLECDCRVSGFHDIIFHRGAMDAR